MILFFVAWKNFCLFLQLLYLGLQFLHLVHRGTALYGERVEGALHEDGQEDDADSVVPEYPMENVQDPKQKLAYEIEPAIGYEAVEMAIFWLREHIILFRADEEEIVLSI